MAITQRQIRAMVTDWRTGGVTCLLIGWPAVGILAEVNLLLESAVPLVYGYTLVLHAVVRDFPGFYPFWVGFALYCSCIAITLVSTFDWVRSRWTASKQTGRGLLTKD